MAAKTAYQDAAVFLPARGAVYIAEPGTDAPTIDELAAWMKAGRSGTIGTAWNPIGYTSLDELPEMSAEAEGGESRGVWEDPNFRTTAVTTTETVTVSPVQLDLASVQRRYGAGATLDETTGAITRPSEYTAVEDAVLIILVDGERCVVFHFWRGSTSPEGDIKPKDDEFIALPFKYTFLNMQGKDGKGKVVGAHLKAKEGGE